MRSPFVSRVVSGQRLRHCRRPSSPANRFRFRLLSSRRLLRYPSTPRSRGFCVSSRSGSCADSTASASAPGAAAGFVSAQTPDLAALARDPDANIRRRTLVAIGRVGMSEGVPLALAGSARRRRRRQGGGGIRSRRHGTVVRSRAARERAARSVARCGSRAMDAVGLIGDRCLGDLTACGATAAAIPAAATAVATAAAGCAAVIAPIDPDDDGARAADDVVKCRSALFALARLKVFASIAAVTLDANGQPVARWWPVAYALQRGGDSGCRLGADGARGDAGVDDCRFRASRSRGPQGCTAACRSPPRRSRRTRRRQRCASRRCARSAELASPDDADTADSLIDGRSATPANLRLEAVSASARRRPRSASTTSIDLLTDPWPAMRSAALASAARLDPDRFLLVSSGLGPDRDWSRPRRARRSAWDPAGRSGAAMPSRIWRPTKTCACAGRRSRRWLRPSLPSPDAHLIEGARGHGFRRTRDRHRLDGRRKIGGRRDPTLGRVFCARYTTLTYAARLAVVARAREDRRPGRDGDAAGGAGRSRVAGSRRAPRASWCRTTNRRRPSVRRRSVSRHPTSSPTISCIRSTRRTRSSAPTPATIEIELDVVDAPLTTQSFIDLARAGAFNDMKVHRVVPDFVVQAGDPRGDGEGGPGYTLRDELSPIAVRARHGRHGARLCGDRRQSVLHHGLAAAASRREVHGVRSCRGRMGRAGSADAVGRTIESVKIWDGVTLR